jgi:HEAT repeat protein
MKIYCPNCFYPNEENQKTCQKCGSLIEWKDESYEDKLIKALSHRDYRIVLRAAEILSNFKSDKTKKALTSIIFKSKDPYIQATAVKSLANISSGKTLKIFREIALSGTLPARLKAIEAIGKKSCLKDIGLLEKLKKEKSETIKAKAKEAIINIKKRHGI